MSMSTMVLVVFGGSRRAKGKEEAMKSESKKAHDMAKVFGRRQRGEQVDTHMSGAGCQIHWQVREHGDELKTNVQSKLNRKKIFSESFSRFHPNSGKSVIFLENIFPWKYITSKQIVLMTYQ